MNEGSQAPRPKFVPRVRGRQAYPALFLIILGAFLNMDTLSAPPEPDPSVGAAASRADPESYHPGKRRMFIFLIDSLRYQTAVDPEIMPNLVALCSESVFAKVNTSCDAVTVPALRAAFTGRDRRSVFGFVKNFWKSEEGIPSMFTRTAADGLRTAVYSDGSWLQFGRKSIQDRFPDESGSHAEEWRRQCEALELALADYREGKHDIVIAHITFSDHVAHDYGIRHEEYRRQFGIADEWVARLAREIPRDENLVVLGDHGHGHDGRHALGLDVPTFGVFRGPGHRPGTDLGTVEITAVRYLAGWGVKVPLPGDYQGKRYPRALVGRGALPADYALTDEQTGASGAEEGGAPLPHYVLLVLYIGLLGALWGRFVLDRPEFGTRWGRREVLWLALIPMALPAWTPWNLALGAALCLLALLAGVRFRPFCRRGLLWIAAPASVLVAFASWGYLLAHLRSAVHEPTYAELTWVWIGLALGGALVCRRRGAIAASWLVLALPILLSYPTAYRYGQAGAMAPALSCWILYVLVDSRREHRREGRSPGPLPYGLLLPIPFLLFPFLEVDSTNFQFEAWLGPLTPAGATGWWCLALVGKALILIRWRKSLLPFLLSVGALVYLMLMQWDEGFRVWKGQVAVIAAALLGMVLLRLVDREARWRSEVRRVLELFALFAGLYYFIRIPVSDAGVVYAWFDCLLATLVLAAHFTRCVARPKVFEASHAFLLAIGLVAAGWCMFAWTLHRLEWLFLYDWFDAAVVEEHTGWFLTPIVLRYSIGVLLVRVVISEAYRGRHPYPTARIVGLVGFKLLSLLCLVIGLGAFQASSDVYFEGAQECLILLVLSLGLW